MNLCLLMFLAVFLSRAKADVYGACPPDKCAEFYPTVKNGIIEMKIYYDNDNPYDIYQWNSDLVNMACDARDAFGSKLLVLNFKMGASTSTSSTGELSCKSHDCYLDRLEACAATQVPDFPTFACCNNRGKSYHKCAAEQGVTADFLNTCVQQHQSDEILLGNSYEREQFELPLCYLPDVLFNDIDKNSRCVSGNTVEVKLLRALGDTIMDECNHIMRKYYNIYNYEYKYH